MSCKHQHSSSPRPFLCSHYLHMYLSTLPLSCREQELSNLLDQGRRSDAVGLAIALDHPKRVLTILNSLLEEEEEEEGFRDTVAALREDQISKWTRCTLSATYFSPLPIAHQRVYVPLFPPSPPLPLPSQLSCCSTSRSGTPTPSSAVWPSRRLQCSSGPTHPRSSHSWPA